MASVRGWGEFARRKINWKYEKMFPNYFCKMSGTANNSTCEISFNSEQLTQLIGPSNILLFDVVKDKIKEKNIELQKKRSHICYINTKLRRIEVEKEQLQATVTRVSEACSKLGQKNVILQSEVSVKTSQVDSLVCDKNKLSELLLASETAHQVLLNEKIWFEESNTELRSQITTKTEEASDLANEKEELARSLAESLKLCEELRKKNIELEAENEEYKEDNDYWRSENRELRTTSSIICDLCLNDV
jgi:chromosome segregation ATPase